MVKYHVRYFPPKIKWPMDRRLGIRRRREGRYANVQRKAMFAAADGVYSYGLVRVWPSTTPGVDISEPVVISELTKSLAHTGLSYIPFSLEDRQLLSGIELVGVLLPSHYSRWYLNDSKECRGIPLRLYLAGYRKVFMLMLNSNS